MKKIRTWFRKNKRAFLIADFLLLITTIGILVATANPADVQGLSVADSTYCTASISWDAAKNAKGYRVYITANE